MYCHLQTDNVDRYSKFGCEILYNRGLVSLDTVTPSTENEINN